MNTTITQEQRERVRQYYTSSIDNLTRTIETEIQKIGGEDMLLQRLDLMEWVYFSQEDIKMSREALRMLNGATDVDGNLISAAIQDRRLRYQHGQAEIERLKQALEECQIQLSEAKKQTEQDKEALDVLTADFASL